MISSSCNTGISINYRESTKEVIELRNLVFKRFKMRKALQIKSWNDSDEVFEYLINNKN